MSDSPYVREIIEREVLLAHDPYRRAAGVRQAITISMLLAAVRFKLQVSEGAVLTAVAQLRQRGYLETGEEVTTTRLTDAGAMRAENITQG